MDKKWRKVISYSTMIFMIFCIFSTAKPLKSQAVSKEIFEKELQAARLQEEKQDHSIPKEKYVWKVKWVGFTDVTYIKSSGEKVRKVMDRNEQRFVYATASEFQEVLKKSKPTCEI